MILNLLLSVSACSFHLKIVCRLYDSWPLPPLLTKSIYASSWECATTVVSIQEMQLKCPNKGYRVMQVQNMYHRTCSEKPPKGKGSGQKWSFVGSGLSSVYKNKRKVTVRREIKQWPLAASGRSSGKFDSMYIYSLSK